MLTFRSGGWVILLAVLLSGVLFSWHVVTILGSRGSRAIGDGKNAETYGFELSGILIPRAELIGSGAVKDGIPALSNPAKISALEADQINRDERGKYLVPRDRVIGVHVNGEACAYPVRILCWHEVVNDTLGGVPIAVTYNPLCDSVVVFERKLGDDAPEFGVSGLLHNSNLIFYDRRPEGVGESLWSQLGTQAIAGPLAGQSLRVLPSALTTWEDWRGLHPDTTVLERDPARKKRYKRNPYNSYYGSDLLRFPVKPPLPPGSPPNKSRIIVLEIAGRRTPIHYSQVAETADGEGRWTTEISGTSVTLQYRTFPGTIYPDTVYVVEGEGRMPVDGVIYSFLFAWHAMYSDLPADMNGRAHR